jgi:hypothetical protein
VCVFVCVFACLCVCVCVRVYACANTSSKTRRITINAEKCQDEHQIRYVLKEELKRFKEDVEKHQVRCVMLLYVCMYVCMYIICM